MWSNRLRTISRSITSICQYWVCLSSPTRLLNLFSAPTRPQLSTIWRLACRQYRAPAPSKYYFKLKLITKISFIKFTLQVGLDFLFRNGHSVFYASDPTWGNHNLMAKHCGYTVKKYRYYDASTKSSKSHIKKYFKFFFNFLKKFIF